MRSDSGARTRYSATMSVRDEPYSKEASTPALRRTISKSAGRRITTYLFCLRCILVDELDLSQSNGHLSASFAVLFDCFALSAGHGQVLLTGVPVKAMPPAVPLTVSV